MARYRLIRRALIENYSKGRKFCFTDDFAAPTSLILVDAIHFEGAWLDGFDPKQTRDMPFYCADGTIREVETMVGRHPLRYIEHAPTNSKIVELPLMVNGYLL